VGGGRTDKTDKTDKTDQKKEKRPLQGRFSLRGV
jgi:hypothetical protein